MRLMNEKEKQSEIDSRLARLLIVVLESDDELFAFFASSRYALLLLMKLLVACEEQGGLSKEQCLNIGSELRSRTHRQNFIEEAVRRGFFAKERSTTDARQVLISPTEKTKRLFQEWAGAYHQVRRAAFGGD
jgi:hypothetical protein